MYNSFELKLTPISISYHGIEGLQHVDDMVDALINLGDHNLGEFQSGRTNLVFAQITALKLHYIELLTTYENEYTVDRALFSHF